MSDNEYIKILLSILTSGDHFIRKYDATARDHDKQLLLNM